MRTKTAFWLLAPVLIASLMASSAIASSIVLDGTFQNSIGTGGNLTPWSDWTGAGITRHQAPSGIPGNYAALPLGADLFQRFAPLSPGNYNLTFSVRDATASSAVLVFAIQQAYGTPVTTVFENGTGEELILPVSEIFQNISFHFAIGSQPYIANELTFSNSYDYPEPIIGNSRNSPGTIIEIANVSLVEATTSAVPETSTWTMMLVGFAGIGFSGYSRWKSRDYRT